MKQEDKLEELIEAWDNKEKAQAIKILRASMSETSTNNKVPVCTVESYVKTTLKAGLSNESFPDYPGDFSLASKSTYYKGVIQAAVKEFAQELGINNDTESLAIAWEHLEKSKNLVDFRKHLKMYVAILKSSFYSEDDIQELTDMIDEQDRQIRELQDYKRIYEEIFEVARSEDENLRIVQETKRLKQVPLTDSEICKVLGITRDKLRYAHKKVSLED